jgi:hypothetical protein
LKIVGVVNDYKEAENIEDIVKVFVVEKRISTILSNNKNKNYEDTETKSMMISTNEIKKIKTPNGETYSQKEENNHKPLFNVRGFN